jgi:F-type H+-transporting ATPase subunit delta
VPLVPANSLLTTPVGACYVRRPRMISGSISRRYARALFGLAVGAGRVEAWSESLLALKLAVEGSPELGDLLENPVHPREQRRAVLARLVELAALDAEVASLLHLLGDRNRLDQLGRIVDVFRELADEQLGRLRARVTSAVPLDDQAARALAAQLSATTRKQVIVERTVDPELVGGVVAQVGSLVFDGSVRTQLEDLRRTLKQ